MFDSYLSIVFLVMAVFGGTILTIQFVLTVLGVGGVDLVETLTHDAGDIADADGSGGDAHSHHGGSDQSEDPHGTASLLGMISFRTLVAAATFFGLAGLAAAGGRQPQVVQVGIALLAGAGAMYGVHSLMRAMGRLTEDGTVRVRKAIGLVATVYVPIAAHGKSTGKVQLSLQNRVMEYEAIAKASHSLATGTKVRVIAVEGNVLEVEPLVTEATASHASAETKAHA